MGVETGTRDRSTPRVPSSRTTPYRYTPSPDSPPPSVPTTGVTDVGRSHSYHAPYPRVKPERVVDDFESDAILRHQEVFPTVEPPGDREHHVPRYLEVHKQVLRVLEEEGDLFLLLLYPWCTFGVFRFRYLL